jgi:hypothetical protein
MEDGAHSETSSARPASNSRHAASKRNTSTLNGLGLLLPPKLISLTASVSARSISPALVAATEPEFRHEFRHRIP